MRRWARALGVLLVVTMGATAAPPAAGHPAEKRRVDPRTGMLEVPLDELVGAVRRKDRAEIGRLASRIGPARLAAALRRSDPPTVQAALAGITALPGRGRLLGPVTELAGSSDATLAAAAARTLGEILGAATAADIDDWDVPTDLVSGACAALRTTAILPAYATPLRLAAIEALGDAAVICPPVPELLSLLKDPTPAIRRATALVVRPQQRLATGGFASGTRDIDPAVASAAVAALCEAMVQPGAWSRGGEREPTWEQVRQAARRLVTTQTTPPDDAVQMLDCLDPTLASDHQILDGIKARRRTPLGDRASEILERFQGRATP